MRYKKKDIKGTSYPERPKLYQHIESGGICITLNKEDAADIFNVSHHRIPYELKIIPVEYPEYWKWNAKQH